MFTFTKKKASRRESSSSSSPKKAPQESAFGGFLSGEGDGGCFASEKDVDDGVVEEDPKTAESREKIQSKMSHLTQKNHPFEDDEDEDDEYRDDEGFNWSNNLHNEIANKKRDRSQSPQVSPRSAPSPRRRGGNRASMRYPLLAATPSRADDPEGKKLKSKSFEEEDDEDDDEEHLASLQEGSFSFILSSPVCSIPFFTALFVFSLESTVFCLIAMNLQTGEPGNPLGFPASVTAPVIVAQFFALLIAVCTQDDVVSALNFIYEGYHGDSMRDAFPPASCFKWILMVSLLLITGTLGLVVTFFLIVTSGGVVELLLNFTAVEFISLLDNGTFLLAQQGFLGIRNMSMCDKVLNTRYEIPMSRQKSHAMQTWMLILSFLLLVAGWAIVYSQQVAGVYTPNTLIVQFDDELDFGLGIYSGLYNLKIRRSTFGFGRNRYEGEDGIGTFGYCSKDQSWTFSVELNVDPCANFIAHSDTSVDFDITTTAANPWFVTTNPDSERYYPMQNFYLAIGCVLDVDCGGLDNDGNPRGTCIKNRCSCNPPFFGWICDYDATDTCETVEADTLLTEPFLSTNKEYAVRLEILKDRNGDLVKTFDHAIYVGPLNAIGEGDVIFYTGLRWALFPIPTTLNIYSNATNMTNLEQLADYFANRFIPNWDITTFMALPEYFLSDPVQFNTPADVSTPVQVPWIRANQANNILSTIGIQTLMLCAICNNQTNPCSNNNTCPANGQCMCTNGASGTLCRITPTGDGFCNYDFFNDAPFSYDGGDCCEFSCRNNAPNTCGFILRNETELVNVQFPNCTNPLAACAIERGNNQCWGTKSQPLDQEIISGANVLLSSNGRIVVQAAPSAEVVRVYDQVDSRWAKRGRDITDVRGSQFGVKVAFYTPPSGVRSLFDISGVNGILVVGLYRQSTAGFRSLYWAGNNWVPIGSEQHVCVGGCNLDSLSIGSSGEFVTVAAAIDQSTVSVYSATYNQTGSSEWQLLSTVAASWVAVSGDGKTVSLIEGNGTSVNVYSVQQGAMQPINGAPTPSILNNDTTIRGLGMSFYGDLLTVVTSDSQSGLDLVTSINVTLPLSTRQHFSSTSVGPLSQRAFSAGFLPLEMSNDASAIAVMVDTSRGPVVRSYIYETGFGWHRVGGDYRGIQVDTRFDTADSGLALAIATTQRTVNVTTLLPRCPGASSDYRIYIPLTQSPGRISWNMESYINIGSSRIRTHTLDKECEGCYDDPTNFGSTLINVDMCVNLNECMEFRYSDTSASPSTPIYLFRDEVEIFKEFGQAQEQDFTVEHFPGCQLPLPNCTAGASPFVLALTLDHNIHETSWSLTAQDGTLIGEGGNYADLTSPTQFYSVCLPPDQCYSFIIGDGFGDGICCDAGEGSYSLHWQGREFVSRSGDQFQYGEKVEFGNCTTRVSSVDSFDITVEADSRPQDISWRIEDSVTGNIFGSSAAAGAVFSTSQPVTTFIPFIRADAVGCLEFFMEDAAGDGNSGYSISINGTHISSSIGRFRFTEKTTIGFGSNCPVDSLSDNLISVRVVLDANPVETTFYIGDMDGNPLNGTFTNVTGSIDPLTNETVFITTYDPIAANNPSNCFTFTISDSAGDGICCTAGNGSYSIKTGFVDITSRSGEFLFGERVRFGRGCPGPLEVFDGFKVNIDLNLDAEPNHTSWVLEDVYGNRITNESYPTAPFGSAHSTTVYHYPESAEDECVVLFLMDSLGDGLCCDHSVPGTSIEIDGSYRLSINNQLIYSGDGDYGFGERVQFGRMCTIAAGKISLMTVNITLDNAPSETSWSVIEPLTNRRLGGVSPGFYSTPARDITHFVSGYGNTSYLFSIFDTAGDGICCSNGNGSYSVIANQDVLVSGDGVFGSNASYLFTTP